MRRGRLAHRVLQGVLAAALVVLASSSSSELHSHRRGNEAGQLEEEILGKEEYEGGGSPRTATGGLINTLLVLLTIVSFIGNALFLVSVFWLSK